MGWFKNITNYINNSCIQIINVIQESFRWDVYQQENVYILLTASSIIIIGTLIFMAGGEIKKLETNSITEYSTIKEINQLPEDILLSLYNSSINKLGDISHNLLFVKIDGIYKIAAKSIYDLIQDTNFFLAVPSCNDLVIMAPTAVIQNHHFFSFNLDNLTSLYTLIGACTPLLFVTLHTMTPHLVNGMASLFLYQRINHNTFEHVNTFYHLPVSFIPLEIDKLAFIEFLKKDVKILIKQPVPIMKYYNDGRKPRIEFWDLTGPLVDTWIGKFKITHTSIGYLLEQLGANLICLGGVMLLTIFNQKIPYNWTPSILQGLGRTLDNLPYVGPSNLPKRTHTHPQIINPRPPINPEMPLNMNQEQLRNYNEALKIYEIAMREYERTLDRNAGRPVPFDNRHDLFFISFISIITNFITQGIFFWEYSLKIIMLASMPINFYFNIIYGDKPKKDPNYKYDTIKPHQLKK